MNCPQCSDDMILTRATDFGSEYFYCRACKKELSELAVLESPPDDAALGLSGIRQVLSEHKLECTCSDLTVCENCINSIAKDFQTLIDYY